MAGFNGTINGATLYALGYVPRDGVEALGREADYHIDVRYAFAYDPFGMGVSLTAPIKVDVPDLPTLTEIDEWGMAHKADGYVIDLFVAPAFDGDTDSKIEGSSTLQGAYVREIAPQCLMRTVCAGIADYVGWDMDAIPF